MQNKKTALFTDTLERSRRQFLQNAGGLTLSEAAIGLMASTSGSAFAGDKDSDATAAKDIRILNTAISAEHEAVAAYQLGAESGLLTKEVLPVVLAFQH